MQILLKDQCKKSDRRVCKPSAVDLGNDLLATSTKSSCEKRSSLTNVKLYGKSDALVEKAGSSGEKILKSASAEHLTPLISEAEKSGFSTMPKADHEMKTSLSVGVTTSFLPNSSLVARRGNDGCVEVDSDIHMSAQGKNNISTPACTKIESTREVKSSVTSNKPESNKSIVRSVDSAPPTSKNSDCIDKQNSVDKKANATPEPAVTDLIKGDEKSVLGKCVMN